MMVKKSTQRKISTKEIIRGHLQKNRGREIPLSEIHDAYKKVIGKDIGRTAISNAIKELTLLGEISSERRSLKHGRYTAIWLAGDNITKPYIHADEVNTESRLTAVIQEEDKFNFTQIEDVMNYLLSQQYNHKILLEEILSLNLSRFDLVTKYIQPLLYEVGIRWEKGILTTGQEHLITSRIEKIIHDLTPRDHEVKSQGNMLLCVVEGDEHNINLLLLEMLLADRYKIINLGRSLPIRSLTQFITDLKDRENEEVDWIFISITLPTLIGTLTRQIQAVQSTFGNIHRIVIGGQGIVNNEEKLSNVDYIISSTEDLEAFLNHLRN